MMISKLCVDLLTSLTREQLNNFKHEDMKNVHNMSAPSHIEPHTPMTTFTGIPSQVLLQNHKLPLTTSKEHISSSRMILL